MATYKDAKIVSCDVRTPQGKTPHVRITFEYDQGAKSITYFGYLSKAAYEYTIEKLQKIGLCGELRQINDILSFVSMNSGLETENLCLKIENETYKGKERAKVKSFWVNKELTPDEKKQEAKKLAAYFMKEAKGELPKAKTKTKKESLPEFNADESLHDNVDTKEPNEEDDLGF